MTTTEPEGWEAAYGVWRAYTDPTPGAIERLCADAFRSGYSCRPAALPSPAEVSSEVPTRDQLGEMVRIAWVKWARTQPDPKPTWLVPYAELSEPDKEADRQIGEALLPP